MHHAFAESARENRLLGFDEIQKPTDQQAEQVKEGTDVSPNLDSQQDAQNQAQALQNQAQNQVTQSETALDGTTSDVQFDVSHDPAVQDAGNTLRSLLVPTSNPTTAPTPATPETGAAPATPNTPVAGNTPETSEPDTPDEGKENPTDKKKEDDKEKNNDAEKKQDENNESTNQVAPTAPRTIGERIEQDLQKAQEKMRDEKKSPMERLGAAISIIILVIQKMQAQMKGELENPIERQTAVPTDEPTPNEEAPETNNTNADDKILRAEVEKHPQGINGVIDERETALQKEMGEDASKVQAIDDDTNTLEKREKSIRYDIRSQEEKMRNANDELATSPGTDVVQRLKLQLEEYKLVMKEMQTELKYVQEKIANNDSKKQLLIDTKGNARSKELNTELQKLQNLRKEGQESVDTMRTTLKEAAHEIGRELGEKNPALKGLADHMDILFDSQKLSPSVYIDAETARELESLAQAKNLNVQLGVKEGDRYVKDLDALTKIFDALKSAGATA